jgi:prepilin-type N-terminal cleavage/methylation domain-containing protein
MFSNTKRKGFTLIELLIVVVIIGILAAIAIPKFASTKDKAKLASVKTDVRNYMSAQEGVFSDSAKYTTKVDATAFTASPGNAITASTGDAKGFTVEISNSSITAGEINKCSVTVGGGGATDGVISCSK